MKLQGLFTGHMYFVAKNEIAPMNENEIAFTN